MVKGVPKRRLEFPTSPLRTPQVSTAFHTPAPVQEAVPRGMWGMSGTTDPGAVVHWDRERS